MRYDNDMMPVEIRAMDLTPGDLVVGDEVREHGRRISHAANSIGRDDRLFTVVAVHPAGGGSAILSAGDCGEYLIGAATPVTVYPVICADCGHPPMDCECNDEHEEN